MAEVNLLEDHQIWPHMEVEDNPSITSDNEELAPTDIPRHGQGSHKDAQEESDRENTLPEVQESPVLSTKEKFFGNQNYSGLIKTKPIYQNLNLQNAHTQTSETITPVRFMDCVLGPERRVLSSPHPQEIQTLPRLLLQRPELEIQGNAFRFEHSTSYVHQANLLCNPSLSKGGDMGITLSRRSPDYCQLQRRMPTQAQQSSRDLERSRLDNQYREVQDGTTTSIRLAWSPLQSSGSHSPEYSGEPQAVSQPTEGAVDRQNNNETQHHASPRNGKLVGASQPISTSTPIQDQTSSEFPQESPTGQEDSGQQQNEEPNGEMVFSPQNSSETRVTQAHIHNPVGRITNRLGLQDRPKTVPRAIRCLNEYILDKCPGTTNNLVGNIDDTRKEPSSPNTHRQLLGSIRHCESIIQHQHSSKSSRIDLEKSRPYELDHNSRPHSRQVQHFSGPIVQKYNHLNRVVPPKEDIPRENPENRTTPPSGSIRNQLEQPVNNLCVTLPRPKGYSSRCSSDRLEQMGTHILIPQNACDFEYFPKLTQSTSQTQSS